MLKITVIKETSGYIFTYDNDRNYFVSKGYKTKDAAYKAAINFMNKKLAKIYNIFYNDNVNTMYSFSYEDNRFNIFENANNSCYRYGITCTSKQNAYNKILKFLCKQYNKIDKVM